MIAELVYALTRNLPCSSRSTSLTYDFQVFQSAAEIPRRDWMEVMPQDNPYLSIDYLKVLENETKENLNFLYGIAYLKGKPVVATAFNMVDFSGAGLIPYIPGDKAEGLTKALLSPFRNLVRFILNRMNWRVLLASNVITPESCSFYFKDINEKIAYQILSDLMCHIKINKLHQGDTSITHFLITDIPMYRSEGDKVLRRKRFSRFLSEPEMMLRFREGWNSYADYLAAITAKYRTKAKSVMKKSKALECRDLDLEYIRIHQDKIFSLYKNVIEKAKFMISEVKPGYFVELKRIYGEELKFKGYFIEDELVSFVMGIGCQGRMDIHFIGLDYEHNSRHRIYQRMLYDDIGFSIENGDAAVNFGRTATEIKSTLGADPIDKWNYMKSLNPLSNLLQKPFYMFLKPAEWTARNPFK